MVFKRCKICYRFIDLQEATICNGKYCHEYSDWQDNIEWDEFLDITDLVDN
jgi:major membrane immunogen (membrane-anchored lipoprotein)